MNDQKPVTVDQRLVHRIGVREWGMPSLVMPGKMWRSEEHGTISCMVASGPDHVRTETRPLEIVAPGEHQWMPDEWRAALWEYVQAWPSSGMELGPFLAITEQERCDFIRAQAGRLLEADNIGLRLVAHDIGAFASVEFETPAEAAWSASLGRSRPNGGQARGEA